METIRKLAILADAAKYDASCASSGSGKRDSRASGGIGSTEGMHSPQLYARRPLRFIAEDPADQLLHLRLRLLREPVSSNVARARFSVDEVVTLTLDFYKRNYIEGLFLSSGIIRNADYHGTDGGSSPATARRAPLRRLHPPQDHSRGLAGTAGQCRALCRPPVHQRGTADRSRLSALAPEKTVHSIRGAMGELRWRIEEARRRARPRQRWRRRPAAAHARALPFRPGRAEHADDRRRGRGQRPADPGQRRQPVRQLPDAPGLLLRVQPSDASRRLPLQPPPLQREHRLYQADWLLRFYGYGVDEITDTTQDGMLDLDIDPKMAWAIRHPSAFRSI